MYFPLFRKQTFFSNIFLTVTICLSFSIIGSAQLPHLEQTNSAIDPLLFNIRKQPRNVNASSGDLQVKNALLSKKVNTSPLAGETDPSLNATIDSFPGNVSSSTIQPDGKIILSGYFKSLNGIRRNNIVRLNIDYSIDPTFSASLNGTALAIALQPDGKIVIGGAFTVVTGVNQYRIARLNSDGSLDATFLARCDV